MASVDFEYNGQTYVRADNGDFSTFVGSPVGYVNIDRNSTLFAQLTSAYAASTAPPPSSIGLGSFSAASVPSFGASGPSYHRIERGSPTYAFDGIQTVQQVGLPVPVIFGEVDVGGNVLDSYISNDGEKNYLNILFGIGEGPLEEISNIRVNDVPISNFSDVIIEIRLGTNDQDQNPITNFRQLHDLTAVGVTLAESASNLFTGTITDATGFKVNLDFPNGIYQGDTTTGNTSSNTVTVKIEWRVYGDTDWAGTQTVTLSKKQINEFRYTFEKTGLAAEKYEIKVTNTTPARSSSTKEYFQAVVLESIDETRDDTIAYVNTAIVAIKLLSVAQLQGSNPRFTFHVKGLKVSCPKVMNMSQEIAQADYYWDSELSKYRLISDGTILSWDGTTYVDRWTRNPIWCYQNVLINKRYGLGDFIDSDEIDSGFIEESRYHQNLVDDLNGGLELRTCLDVVLDSATNANDLLTQLASSFDAIAPPDLGYVRIKTMKEETPIALVGFGDLASDVRMNWLPIKDRPNVVEVTFFDGAKGYAQESVIVTDEDSLSAGNPIRSVSKQLFTSRKSEATRMANRILQKAKYIKRTFSFSKNLEPVNWNVGDVINLSCDTGFFGISELLISGSSSHLKFPQAIDILGGESVKIQFMDDDSVESSSVDESAGSYSEVDITPALSRAPAAGDIFIVGTPKPIRITGINRSFDESCNIEAEEYHPELFSGTPALPTDSYSELSPHVPNVENLTATESLVKLQDGTIEDQINLSFMLPSLSGFLFPNRFVKTRIFLSDNDGASWTFRGDTFGTSFDIVGGIKDGVTYKVAAVSASNIIENKIESSPQAEITVEGKSADPSDVTSFSVRVDKNDLVFTWSPAPDVDLYAYEIRQGDSWEGGVVIHDEILGTVYRKPVHVNGEIRFMIKAIDTSYNKSANEAVFVLEVDAALPEVTVLDAIDLDSWDDGIISGAASLFNVTDSGDQVIDGTGNNVVTLDPSGLEKITGDTIVQNVIDGEGNQVIDGTGNNVVNTVTLPDYLRLTLLSPGQYATEGSYASQVVDMGQKIRAKIELLLNVEVSNGAYELFVRTSDDNVTWSDWSLSAPGDYEMRYFQAKVRIFTYDPSEVAKLRALKAFLTVLHYSESGIQEITSSGTINSTLKYWQTFNVQAIVVGSGKYARVTARNNSGDYYTGINVEVRNDSDGSLATGDVSFHFSGY